MDENLLFIGIVEEDIHYEYEDTPEREPILFVRWDHMWDRIVAANLKVVEERDAWKTLHDAKGHIYPYAYASQKQLNEIERAEKILGMI